MAVEDVRFWPILYYQQQRKSEQRHPITNLVDMTQVKQK